jgi:hypothetical protein
MTCGGLQRGVLRSPFHFCRGFKLLLARRLSSPRGCNNQFFLKPESNVGLEKAPDPLSAEKLPHEKADSGPVRW